MKLPPQNLEAERAVLGGMLIDNEAIHRVVEFLEPDDFYKEAHRKIYQAVLDLYQANEPSDLVTITNLLKSNGSLESIGGATFLSSLVDQVATAAHIAHYAKIIREKSVLRQLIDGATSIVTRGYEEESGIDEFLDSAERVIFDIATRRIQQGFYPVKDVVKASFKSIEQLYEKKELVTGVATGYKDLDRLTAGLQSSDLVIIAGRPSSGKTAFALNIIEHAACDSKLPCAIFSLEMSKEQLVQRLLCSRGEVDSYKLRGGFLAESDWPKLTRAAGVLSEAPIFIDDSPVLTVLEMRAKARRLKKERGLSLLVVDYLQLVRSSARFDNREREISEISRGLKALAKELHIPVVALSQLNRGVENRQDKRPMLADLRESGSIEQDADVVMFIYRDEMYNTESPDTGKAEVIISKQRNGPTGKSFLAFRSQFTRFDNLAKGMEEYLPPVEAEPIEAEGETPF
ncbi:MAG: replicative DNA helicase [Deltaproteobacteria bacterium RIFCSPLOWO2_12_FULL_44_12]|nr:MAG: replicative DNA helicase [Deltaproteobacteria bacterium RIFCSPHIGHO2_01_FULL_43_49]OGQ15910.1 MAG: replicative DNA helicase [Deltaproteobacteria bacterium RIFCSPHIGHO2_02_FULL_44_53]OGQ28873.1 MAG: replicative DNA helicase [Deltaproteobacteria bacterium RIFCSPHIGHO2_12_FULL_44_21]OGQ30965.1 MAG: replicative DNA helicase [Deltaproteobacteria bacterium RIFCSPLOWO2_01_FULL_45_74]OGQ43471.1 MAG: replicative DNA helicase [Deltaproteobacteria bacterium RIFCSPLOWO2_02_FULL_44_34]OGQ70508.1 MA